MVYNFNHLFIRRMRIKNERTTLYKPNAGLIANMKVNTLNNQISERKVKCLEIPHYA